MTGVLDELWRNGCQESCPTTRRVNDSAVAPIKSTRGDEIQKAVYQGGRSVVSAEALPQSGGQKRGIKLAEKEA